MIAFAIQIVSNESVDSADQTNLYTPITEFNVNVKECKQDMTAAYFMKKDPELPFGDFTIRLVFNELGENENHYITNTLEIDEDASPYEFHFEAAESENDQLVPHTKHQSSQSAGEEEADDAAEEEAAE